MSDFCRIAVCDPEMSTQFHIIAHELAENIAKYSTASDVSLDLELVEKDGQQTLSVRTRNRTSPERLAEVQRRLQELEATDDPAALYDRLMQESLAHEGVSGLGLVRIRAESGFDLDYAVEGDELTIVVSAAVPSPPALKVSAEGAGAS